MSLFAQNLQATPQVVLEFYNGIEKMEACNSTSELGKLEISMTKCFFMAENSGINLPNDFRFFKEDEHSISHSLDILTSNNYINKLSEYIAQKKIMHPNVAVNTYSEESGLLPTMEKKGKNMELVNERAYIRTIVRKRYSFSNSNSKEFIDTVYTHKISKKIRLISNGNGTLPIDNPEYLLIEAAKAYEAENYQRAFELLKRITELDAKNSEAYFRMAVMKFEGKRIKKNIKEAKDYMYKAAYNNTSDIYSSKAKTILDHWTHPNGVIF